MTTWKNNHFTLDGSSLTNPKSFYDGGSAYTFSDFFGRNSAVAVSGNDQVVPNFADPTVSLEKYSQSHSDGTSLGLMTALRDNHFSNWNPDLSAIAINFYLRSGFSMKQPYVYSQGKQLSTSTSSYETFNTPKTTSSNTKTTSPTTKTTSPTTNGDANFTEGNADASLDISDGGDSNVASGDSNVASGDNEQLNGATGLHVASMLSIATLVLAL